MYAQTDGSLSNNKKIYSIIWTLSGKIETEIYYNSKRIGIKKK